MGSGLWLGDEGEGELGGVPRLPHPARPLDPFQGAGQRRRRGRERGVGFGRRRRGAEEPAPQRGMVDKASCVELPRWAASGAM